MTQTGTIGNESLWNTDQDQYSNILMGIKKKVMIDLDEWNVVNCYWSLRSLWRELDAKFEEEREELTVMINELEGLRQQYEQGANIIDTLWTKEEEFYLKLCQYMKKHKIYYREAFDQRKAIFN
jgi:predicted nuclease with TOPRIM domain